MGWSRSAGPRIETRSATCKAFPTVLTSRPLQARPLLWPWSGPCVGGQHLLTLPCAFVTFPESWGSVESSLAPRGSAGRLQTQCVTGWGCGGRVGASLLSRTPWGRCSGAGRGWLRVEGLSPGGGHCCSRCAEQGRGRRKSPWSAQSRCPGPGLTPLDALGTLQLWSAVLPLPGGHTRVQLWAVPPEPVPSMQGPCGPETGPPGRCGPCGLFPSPGPRPVSFRLGGSGCGSLCRPVRPQGQREQRGWRQRL